MLYYLFDYLEKTYHIPGAGLFQFLTFRAGLAIGFSLLIAAIFGKKIALEKYPTSNIGIKKIKNRPQK